MRNEKGTSKQMTGRNEQLKKTEKKQVNKFFKKHNLPKLIQKTENKTKLRTFFQTPNKINQQ